jgi:hypothetical protein
MMVGQHWQEKPLLEAACALETVLAPSIIKPPLQISYPRAD